MSTNAGRFDPVAVVVAVSAGLVVAGLATILVGRGLLIPVRA